MRKLENLRENSLKNIGKGIKLTKSRQTLVIPIAETETPTGTVIKLFEIPGKGLLVRANGMDFTIKYASIIKMALAMGLGEEGEEGEEIEE